MDVLTSTQFEQVCRACMENFEGNESVLQSLFDYVDDYQNKRIQIFELLNMTVQNLPKIEIMDALPKNLCNVCVEKLCAFYEFQNQIIITDQHLRQVVVTRMVQASENNSTDPLQSIEGLSEIEDFIKEDIVKKKDEDIQKFMQDEDYMANDNFKQDISRASTDAEEEQEEEKKVDNNTLDCEICHTTFLYKRNLVRHMKRKHSKSTKKLRKTKQYDSDSDNDISEEQPTPCDICGKSFLHYKNLQRHMKRAHDTDSKKTTETTSTIKKQPSHNGLVLKKQEDDNNEENKESSNETNVEPKLTDEAGNENTEIEIKIDFDGQNETNIDDNSDVERVYLCEICETEFTYKKNLKRHMKRTHDFEWPKDVIMESDALETNVSKKVKKDNRTWTCEICKTEFLYKRNLRRHMKRTHNEESPIDIKTGLDDIIPAAIKLENKSDSESSAEEWDIPKISIWTCERCQKKFTYKKNLKRHMKHIHNEELPNDDLKAETGTDNASKMPPAASFKCNECDSVFHKKVYLRKHKYRHKKPGGLKREKRNCNACGLECKTLQCLREHYKNVHPDRLETDANQLVESLKLYICQYCNKSFQQSSTLKDHLRVHTKEQPFLCSHCGKAFNSSSNLKQHILRHETEKRYECPECPKKFPCLSDLASHKQVHKQLKPHVCDICGAAFGKPYQLKTHKMYHNGEKRYQCEYCAMRFVCGDHLRRHIRTHTGEKPYKCKYCPRSFSQSNDMIKHLRTHLGDNVYQCELCPAAFRLAAELRTHFALHKNDDEETKKRNKLAWHEAQERLKLKLASTDRPAALSKAKETTIVANSNNSSTQGSKVFY